MNSTKLSDPLRKVGKAALARWKLETLTGLLGIRSLQHHQAETERNVSAENRAVRKHLWGVEYPDEESDDMHTQTILGDVTHPTPIVIAGQQSSGSGLAKVLAGIALGTMIPAAAIGGFAISKLIDRPTPQADPPPQFTDESLDIGLIRYQDLKK